MSVEGLDAMSLFSVVVTVVLIAAIHVGIAFEYVQQRARTRQHHEVEAWLRSALGPPYLHSVWDVEAGTRWLVMRLGCDGVAVERARLRPYRTVSVTHIAFGPYRNPVEALEQAITEFYEQANSPEETSK